MAGGTLFDAFAVGVVARGLTLEGDTLVFRPVLPIDYLRKLKEFYVTATAVAQAA